jgi:protein O-GlcNAc transferase
MVRASTGGTGRVMLKNLMQALLRRSGGAETALAGEEAAARLRICIDQAARSAAAGDHAAAVDSYCECLELEPRDPRLWCNFGAALNAIGEAGEAELAYRRALELSPDLAHAWYNLGALLQERGSLEEAERCYACALPLVEADSDHWLWLMLRRNQGLLLQSQGQSQEAVDFYRQALAERPQESGLRSNLLFALNNLPGVGPPEMRAEHLAWGRLHAPEQVEAFPVPADGQAIRLGYVSADFCSHALAAFTEPVLRHHDRAGFHVTCYDNGTKSDAVTARMRSYAGRWRAVSSLSDAELAQTIREDGIDILIDVSGHTSGNRLLVFAQKPAPLQLAYLGYLNTSGMRAMDYRVTDACADPPGISDWVHSETLVRLPHTLWCYQPPQDAPPVSELPALREGHVNFVSTNSIGKLNQRVLQLWASVLDAVPGSRLLLMAVPDARTAARIREGLSGIAPERVSTLSRQGRAGYWAQFAGVDIALDPFPYSGGASTCDALWMGVPVVTLAGDYGFSRSGASILANAGLPQLIAQNAGEYVRAASALAADLPALERMRQSMRERLLASPLLDAPNYTRALEAQYRSIWQRWRSAQGRLHA